MGLYRLPARLYVSGEAAYLVACGVYEKHRKDRVEYTGCANYDQACTYSSGLPEVFAVGFSHGSRVF